jgi:hypothetical protein
MTSEKPSRRSVVKQHGASTQEIDALARGMARAFAIAKPRLEPDPIFAAIKKYKTALDKFGEAIGEKRQSRAGAALHKANHELVTTVPTTRAGMVAVLQFAENDIARGDGTNVLGRGYDRVFLATMRKALEQIAV